MCQKYMWNKWSFFPTGEIKYRSLHAIRKTQVTQKSFVGQQSQFVDEGAETGLALVGEEVAVDVKEDGEVEGHVWVALILRRVQDL